MNKNIFLVIDFDSTIISCETLDEISNLAIKDNLEKNNKIKTLTNQAMNGEIDFTESLNQRLEILNINKSIIDKGIELIKTKISHSFIYNSNFIKKNADNIYIVSGGFIEFIRPVAEFLGIKPNHIFCNSFIKNQGRYKLDTNNVMMKNLGKVEVVKNLNINGEVVVIGDGYTDYEIKKYGYSNIFIAYTEHVSRKKVVDLADYRSNSFDDIIDYLSNL